MVEVYGVVMGHVNRVIIEKSVFKHLYSYREINWCAKIDVKHKGGWFGIPQG